jgi:hypothetical protein
VGPLGLRRSSHSNLCHTLLPPPPARARVAQVEPGEIVRLDKDGISSFKVWGEAGPPRAPAFCVFEYVYFARPDR